MKKFVLLLLLAINYMAYSQPPPDAIFVAEELYTATAEYTYDEEAGFEKTWNWGERVKVHVPIAIKSDRVIMENSGELNIEIVKVYESIIFKDDDGDEYTTYIFDGIDQNTNLHDCYFRNWHDYPFAEFTMYCGNYGATYKGYIQKKE